MKKIFFLFPVIIFIISLSGCDYVEIPQQVGNSNTPPPASGKVRKILVEDYTGHKCGNCPRGAEALESLKQSYGDKIVGIAIHVGSGVGANAVPVPPNPKPADAPTGSFAADFRTSVGQDYYDATFNMEAAGLPGGMINRIGFPTNTHDVIYTNWGSKVAGIITTAPDAGINITIAYDAGTRTLTTNIQPEFLNILTGTYKLVVLLTEDSIIDWQEDYNYNPNPSIQNYVFRDVLRDAINNAWGDTIANGTTNAGVLPAKNYSYTIPSAYPTTSSFSSAYPISVPSSKTTNCNDSNCYVVAFIYNATQNDPKQYEVIQAERKKIR